MPTLDRIRILCNHDFQYFYLFKSDVLCGNSPVISGDHSFRVLPIKDLIYCTYREILIRQKEGDIYKDVKSNKNQ